VNLSVTNGTGTETLFKDTENPNILGVDHVAIAVEDLEAAVETYQRLFGFTVLERRTTRGERTEMLSAVLKSGTTIIVLIQGTSPESQVSRFIQNFGPGVQHIAFAVADLDEALKTVGETDTPVIEDVGIRQVFLQRTAGTGVRIELIERRGGQFSDQSVSRLFRAFEERDLY